MLDVECFTYLNKALESPISPIVVLASNRGMATIRGADDLVAAHGIPPDFLARLLIIPTHPYEPDEIKRIVRIRASTEGVQVTDAAIDKIAEHGVRISLRYCLQLLTPARCVVSATCSVSTRESVCVRVGDVLTGQQHPGSGQWAQPDRRPGCRRV
jgi:DNA helicase TIP49 (TBP-interacting protein)